MPRASVQTSFSHAAAEFYKRPRQFFVMIDKMMSPGVMQTARSVPVRPRYPILSRTPGRNREVVSEGSNSGGGSYSLHLVVASLQ